MRRWGIGLLPAAIIGVTLLSMVGTARPAAAQQSDRVAVVSRFFDAWSRGDAEQALTAFADNAVFIAARVTGPCAGQTPCTDLAGIRSQIDFAIGLHICQTLRSVQVSGSIVTGQFETRTDTDRANGVERLARSFIAQIPNDKITFFAVLNDLADPQTAGTQRADAPLPNPETPCAGVWANPTRTAPDFLVPRPQASGEPLLVVPAPVAGPAGGGSYSGQGYLNSGIVSEGNSVILTIDAPAGTYEYLCLIHWPQGMKGTLVVTE